jgi:hypothetical protein
MGSESLYKEPLKISLTTSLWKSWVLIILVGLQDRSVAVHVQGLVKTYPGSHKCVGCRLKATKPYHAVKVWLVFFTVGKFPSIR